MINRRHFMLGASALGTLGTLGYQAVASSSAPMKILMLGGTGFLGPHTVRYALERGHNVTLFNRGRSDADLFPELETIIGDRDPDVDKGLSGLKGRQFDAVIDTSGFIPRIVGASAQLLADQADHYLFVSTICQYDNWMAGPIMRTEDEPRATLDDPTTEDVSTHYCALKAYCEVAAETAMSGRVTQIRPGLIVGPRDRSDRFTYWPVRMARGGNILAPGKPSDLTQYVDVRDLAQFMVHCVEQQRAKAYNVVCTPMSLNEFLTTCRETINPEAGLTWVPSDFLAAHDVLPWEDLRAWAPAGGEVAGSLAWSSERALADGLTIRPLSQTFADTLAWFKSLPEERQSTLRSGLSAEKEASILAAWKEHQSTVG